MKQNSLLSGSIPEHLFRLTAPMILAILAHMSFNLVDTYFVSKLGALELTAISFSFPVVMVLLNLAIGYGIGCTSVLSRLIGSGENLLAKKVGSISVYLMMVAAVLLCVTGVSTTDIVFTALGAKPEHLGLIHDYMKWAYPAMGLRMVAIAVSSLFKSNGFTSIPSKAMLITAIINIILDPIFIFGLWGFPPMGIAGAGLATLIANIVAVTYELYSAARVYHFFSLPHRLLKEEKQAFLQIFSIGLPSAFANALNPLSISLGNFFLAQASTAAVAGFGVAAKIQSFSMIPVLALSSATGPLIGQNFSAGNKKRLKSILLWVYGISLGWFFLQATALYVFGEQISSVFSTDPIVLSTAKAYLRIVSWSLVGYSFVILTSSIMNASNQPIKGFSLIFVRTLCVFPPMYFLLDNMGVDFPVVWAYFSANYVALTVSLVLLAVFYKKHT